jgi:hypothetical protein
MNAAKSVTASYTTSGSTVAACPSSIASSGSTSLTCNCTATAASSGSVWGAGPYTSDSALCRAAVHAGVISASTGGNVTANRTSTGCSTYLSTTKNGVTTTAWTAYTSNLIFQGQTSICP